MDWAGNGTGRGAEGRGLWNRDYLISCFAEEKICVSFGLWLLSCLFWVSSCCLLFYLKCKQKPRYEESVFWNIYGFFGSMCNTIGALLSKQLTIQIITGAYMALLDIINFVFTLFPACNPSHRVRLRQRSSRRKYKPVLSALSISMLLSLGYCCSIVKNDLHSFEMPPAPRRRLLGIMLQENTDVLGFTLGIIAVFVSWTVRVPIITSVCKGLVFPVIQVWALLFSALASVMYAAAIISHDCRPEYLVKAIPWFLLSMGAAALDAVTMFLSCIMKNKLIQDNGLLLDATWDEESCELLASKAEEANVLHKATVDAENSGWTPLNMVPNRCLSSKASPGRYVRLSVEQVQENIGKVRLPGDGQTNPGNMNHKEPLCYLGLPVYAAPRIAHSTNSSSSSPDALSNTTDLEWDFEDLDQNWNKDSDFPSIQPNDSSVLQAINISHEQLLPSTIWATFKSVESTRR